MNEEYEKYKRILELYIQVTKLTDANKELDEQSLNTMKGRYEGAFGEKLTYYESNEQLEKIKIKCEENLRENIKIILSILKEKFNYKHEQYQTENTYNAIAYEENSIVREIFQNIFDQIFNDDIIKIEINFNDKENKISFKYNEEGFDLKSLIFYFSAGDNAKHDKQTGKFGLGIKSVMYNSLSLECKSIYNSDCYMWRVISSICHENKEEVKKNLTLEYLEIEPNYLEGNFKGTELTIELDKYIYSEIKENFLGLENGLNKYIDIPEIIFAFKHTYFIQGNCVDKLKVFINEDEKYIIKLKDFTKVEFNDLTFNSFEGKNYIEEILYLEGETNIFKNCESLYATYKLIDDRTLFSRGGKIFISVKSKYVISTRKVLKDADNNKNLVINEAESILCEFANNCNNKGNFKIKIYDNLKVEYSKYLEDFMYFIKNKKSELFKDIYCPKNTTSGRKIDYYYHSAISQIGHQIYAESYKGNNEEYYNTQDSIYNYRYINEKINFLVDKLLLLDNEKLNIFIDMFRMKYIENKEMDFSSIEVKINSKDTYLYGITNLIKLVFAPKQQLKYRYEKPISGFQGSFNSDSRIFKRYNTLKNLFAEKSYYSILSKLNLNDEKEIESCLEGLRYICDNNDVEELDVELFNEPKDELLNIFFASKIEKIKKKLLEKRLKNEVNITFNELLKQYNSIIDITEIGVGKKIEFVGMSSFYSKFLPKNQERLEKVINANKHIENFTLDNIYKLLQNALYLKCSKKNGDNNDYILIVRDNKVDKIEKYTNLKERLQGRYWKTHLFCDLEELVLNENDKFIWITTKRKINSEIEVYIDSYLKAVGNNSDNLRGFSNISDIKIKTINTDQAPYNIKVEIPIKKSSFNYMIKEIELYLNEISDLKIKNLLYKDFNSELYGNGYCCSVKKCDFDIANEYAYDILYLNFQSYNLPVYLCQNHKMILSNEQIYINEIEIGNLNIDEALRYIEKMSEDESIISKFRYVTIKYVQKVNNEFFNPDLNSELEDKYEECDITEKIKLSPINLALWYYLNSKKITN